MQPTIIMVAPNGARKTHKDHPALPVSIEETVNEAVACFKAGATALHAHVRGDQDQHLLDAGLYTELIAELKQQAPEMLVQITTEAVGIFTPNQQVECVKEVLPEMASVSLKELTTNFSQVDFAKDFYHWSVDAGIHIQHIIYSADEFEQFLQLKASGVIPASHRCVLFVLGRYSKDLKSTPSDLKPFLKTELIDLNWFTCAFGQLEQACICTGIKQGGHARIGFENNIYLPNGELASTTAALVSDLMNALGKENISVANAAQTREILGIIR